MLRKIIWYQRTVYYIIDNINIISYNVNVLYDKYYAEIVT